MKTTHLATSFEGKCPRKVGGCLPLTNVVSDDGSTFVCCGYSEGHTRIVKQDEYRFCCKSVITDTMCDYDELDLLDQIEVMAGALATHRRLERATSP